MINASILRSFSRRLRNYAYLVYMKRVIKCSRLTVKAQCCQRARFYQLNKLHCVNQVYIN